jgi:hypothetical protein
MLGFNRFVIAPEIYHRSLRSTNRFTLLGFKIRPDELRPDPKLFVTVQPRAIPPKPRADALHC